MLKHRKQIGINLPIEMVALLQEHSANTSVPMSRTIEKALNGEPFSFCQNMADAQEMAIYDALGDMLSQHKIEYTEYHALYQMVAKLVKIYGDSDACGDCWKEYDAKAGQDQQK
jgi:hypothetical protein